MPDEIKSPGPSEEEAVSFWHEKRVKQVMDNYRTVMGDVSLPSLVKNCELFRDRPRTVRFRRYSAFISSNFTIYFTGDALTESDYNVLAYLVSKDKTRAHKVFCIDVPELLNTTGLKTVEALETSVKRLQMASVVLSLSNPKGAVRMSFYKFECVVFS